MRSETPVSGEWTSGECRAEQDSPLVALTGPYRAGRSEPPTLGDSGSSLCGSRLFLVRLESPQLRNRGATGQI